MYSNSSLYVQDIETVLKNDFSPFRGKTFFMTGTSGLVGRFLLDILMYLNINYDFNIHIYATFSSSKSAENCLNDYGASKYFHALIHNINESVKNNLVPDYVVHAASNTHPELYTKYPVETMKINFIGTVNILEVAKRNPKCRTLYISTLEVYGEDFSRKKFSEHDIGFVDFTLPRSCYPESKRACETLCQSYRKEFGMDIQIARLGYIYGPTVNLNSSKADVQFLCDALNYKNIIMKSSGMQKRSYCYVADVVSALLFILIHGKNGEAYNIASPSGNILLKDFASMLAKLAGVSIEFKLPSEAERQGYSTVKNSTLNATKLEQLGWCSMFSLEEGIAHTLHIKRENEHVVRA